MFAVRLAGAAAGAGLLAAIVWASFSGAIFEEGGAILDLPWGIVTFLDLYAGFAFAALVMAVCEPRRPLGAALAVSVFFLGNVVTLLWLALRAPLLLRRLSGKADI